jgi:hypothetical protein
LIPVFSERICADWPDPPIQIKSEGDIFFAIKPEIMAEAMLPVPMKAIIGVKKAAAVWGSPVKRALIRELSSTLFSRSSF